MAISGVFRSCAGCGANWEYDMNLPPQLLGMTYGTPLDTLQWPETLGPMPGFWYGRDDKGVVVKCFRSGDGAHG